MTSEMEYMQEVQLLQERADEIGIGIQVLSSLQPSAAKARAELVRITCESDKPLGSGEHNEIFDMRQNAHLVMRIPKHALSWRSELKKVERYDLIHSRLSGEGKENQSESDVCLAPALSGLYAVAFVDNHSIGGDSNSATVNFVIGVAMEKLQIFRLKKSILEWPYAFSPQGKPDINRAVALVFSAVTKMVMAGVFHNDLHNHNVVLTSRGLEVIDFDGGCIEDAKLPYEINAKCDPDRHAFGELGPEHLISWSQYNACVKNEGEYENWHVGVMEYLEFMRKYHNEQFVEIFGNDVPPGQLDDTFILDRVTRYMAKHSKCDAGAMLRCFVPSQMFVVAQLTITKIMTMNIFSAITVLVRAKDRSLLEDGLDPKVFRLLVDCLGLVPEQRPTPSQVLSTLAEFL